MLKIDAHQHLWHYTPDAFPWISENMAVLKKDYLPAEAAPLLAAHGFNGCVAVQAQHSEAETRFLLQLADEHDFIKGVVGWVDLQDAAVKQRLEHWRNHPKFKGVRHILQDEPEEQFMLRPEFVRGIKVLHELDLSYDLLIFEKQLPETLQLLSKLPEMRLVTDHLAKPKIASHELSPWKENIQLLAAYPHVYCKISGMITEASHNNWKAEDFIPYLDVIVEAFGTERLMFGSDFPVCLLAGAYEQVLQVVEEYFQPFTTAEKERVFGKNAIQFYKLEL